MPPHNMTMTLLGASILWFGWFGFNGGSAVASGVLATSAFVVTHIAAATAALSWLLVEWLVRGKPTILGAASGCVAGLVAITPASGFVGPMSALLIGLGVGALCFYGVSIKNKLGFDDSLDVVGVHGVGGAFGALATGLLASQAINPAASNGLFFGNASLLGVQLVSVLAASTYAFGMTWVILKVLDWVIGLRVSTDDEVEGLDLSQHGESGYSF
jgi:Amt family ammonium transporter